MEHSVKYIIAKTIDGLHRYNTEYDMYFKELYCQHLKKNIHLIRIIRDAYIFMLKRRYTSNTNNFNDVPTKMIYNNIHKKIKIDQIVKEINVCNNLINEINNINDICYI
ncbi:hypothetical protein Hokovirus_3_123 [Hokovirus HKV1]|uniref:Uncharacterized protein n=1 Tax=Hokovirus HKV1 TaxID=1977638 RepID=A0A1V0SGJ9_9VIRU|nr:hypothetical protein Hokovirus_3_123 [Hokovirus HKV1]